jgi:3-oxoacyl-[acyl-carrier-protein] synthase II
MQRRVVITGVGAISPLGVDLNSTWKGLSEGKSGGAIITQFDASEYPCQIAAEVKGFSADAWIPMKEQKRYDRFSIFSVVAAQEAWDNSGVKEGDYHPRKMGCIIGVGIGGLHVLEENHKAILDGGPRRCSPFLIPAMIANLAPGHVAIRLGLKGINYTTTSACTSGAHAIGEAFRMIREGRQDLVVTGGAEATICPLALGGFGRMKALTTRNDAPDKASRPFDRNRDGFLIGEGAGILVLEEYESAKKRGANIMAEVVGYGFSCDAYHITGQPEDGEGAVASMQMALDDAGLNPEDISYINAHGTSTPINDPTETKAIKTVFGSYAHNGLLVSSTKSMTGHLLGGAGGLEGVICAKAIQHSLVPPTINLEEPEEGCDLDYVPNVSREKKLKGVISNSFGFGGTNATVAMKSLA